VWEIACWILLVCDVLDIKLEFENVRILSEDLMW